MRAVLPYDGCTGDLSVALFIVFIAFIWGGSMGFTLLITRFRLAPGDASIGDQLIVRFVAFFSVTIAMFTLGVVSGRTSVAAETTGLVPYLWGIAVIPLLIPSLKSRGVSLFSSERLIYTSVSLSAVGGVVLAMATLVQLIRNGPDFV
jgi:hypothetical protein